MASPADTTVRTCVVDTSYSPHACLRPVPVSTVTLADNFWAPRLRINREVTLPAQFRLLEETRRLANLSRAAAPEPHGNFHGYFFNDSDVHKWLEAVAWAQAAAPDPVLAQWAETVVDIIEHAQQPDGYLDSYFMFERAGERWTNLRDLHELYCAGHLIQAAIADYRATGGEQLMRIARRCADLICATFGPEAEGKRPGICGHPEIEMALAELARLCGEEKYLATAQYFIDARGHGLIGGRDYHQDHAPLRDRVRMNGHAVRALYLNAGAADVVAESGDPALRASLESMWQHMVARQLYLTGGAGPHHQGEAFGADYELPNARAYAETCAAIAVVMWAWRMLLLTGEATYADVMEQALYNGFLSGVSLDGLGYFYENPLADDGSHRRQPWFDCACCPPNVARTFASLPGYFYSTNADGIWAHLYAGNGAQLTLADGRVVRLSQRTRYPWDGEIEISVDGAGEFMLHLRIPAWCEVGATLAVNGQPVEARPEPGSYATIRRTWQPGDLVQLHLPMPVQRIVSHPYAAENRGRVALMRGPLLYCVEGADLHGIDPRDIVLNSRAQLNAEFQPNLLGGVVALTGHAGYERVDSTWSMRLYRAWEPEPFGARISRPATAGIQPLPLTAIPYYAWANRAPGPMQVWLRHKTDGDD